jgi:hypothetical protein
VLAHPECLFAQGLEADDEVTADVPRDFEVSSNPSTSSATGVASAPLCDASTAASTSLSSSGSTIKLSIAIASECDAAEFVAFDDHCQNISASVSKGRFVLHKGLR